MKINKPLGVPTLFPYLTVKDGVNSIDFYTKAFGFKLRDKAENENGLVMHAEMLYEDALIMFASEGAYPGFQSASPKTAGIKEMPVAFYVYCEDVDALYEHACKNGAISKSEPFDGFWGDRMCTLIDIDGYVWSFAMPIQKG